MTERLIERVRQVDVIDLVALLTIALLLVRRIGWSEPFVVALCIGALVHPPLRRRGELWLAIGLLRIVSLIPLQWANIENVTYLVTWWCIALGVALLTSDPQRALAVSARWMLGLVFAVAVFWKFASPDFPDGGFFTFSIVTDLRLDAVAHAAGVGDTIAGNRSALLAMLQPGGPEAVSLAGTESVRGLSQVMTIGTFVLEGLVTLAVLFRTLFPDWVRTGLLVAFVLVTYALAPIVGFGWIILLLAIAQTRPDEQVARATFAGLFVALPVLAWVAGLGDAALPTFTALVAAAAFVAYLRGGRLVLRDGGILLATASLGQLAEVSGTEGATAVSVGIGALAVLALRLAERVQRSRA